MRAIDPRSRLVVASGAWRTFGDVRVWDLRTRDIYRSPLEPSFVCWAILWKERDGALKLSFTEAVGDPSAWPPVYDLNRDAIQYYRKTLVSMDEGETWTDPGWRDDLRGVVHGNSDHHIRMICRTREGPLLLVTWRMTGETVLRWDYHYDETLAMSHFPFRERGPVELPLLRTCVRRSLDQGKTWEEIHLFGGTPHFLGDAIRQLADGSIVATGAMFDEWARPDTWKVAITESGDGGRTWSAPQAIASNDDTLIPQIMGEESDFVELSDGRLLLIERTDGPGMVPVQMYVRRERGGRWVASAPTANPAFDHTGFPYMCKASDGTVFCYFHTGMLYSCDDGATWNTLPFGQSYYGQLVEAVPGKMVAVTQKHIGDSPYPWRHDTAMHQTTFLHERIGVAEQTDAAALGAVATLSESELSSFHLSAEVRADGEAGIAFHVREDRYGFVVVVVSGNEFRAPGRAAGKEQDAVLFVGESVGGTLRVLRRQWMGKLVPGSWVEMQVSVSADVLRAAVKTSAQAPATYVTLRHDFGGGGKIGLFTNKSTGAFRNLRLSESPLEIRSNWGRYAELSAGSP